MGLTKTWLDKIGLGKLYPKFEEAGITHPKYFLALDASCFESLGVTNEDDQRKLLLMFETVKLALMKRREAAGGSMSENFAAEYDDWKVEEEEATDTREKTVAMRNAQPRRSRRLATKMQHPSPSSSPPIIFPSLAAAVSPKARAASRKDSSAKDKVQPRSHAETESASRTIVEKKGEETNSSPEHRTRASLATAPPQSRRGAQPSKLPASLRTGKNLSAIPSESAAPPSPLVEFSSSHLNEEMDLEDDKPKRKEFVSRLSRQHPSSLGNKRRTTLSGSGDELEELLQSSASESSMGFKLDAVLAGGSDSESESATSARRRRQIPQLNKSHPSKIVGANEFMVEEKNSRRLSTATRPIKRPVANRRQSTALSHDGTAFVNEPKFSATAKSATSKKPIVQGMNEPESWASQIENLREDNDTEHDLFRDQLDHDQQEYFDMRIKVIVRKRPMSKTEASRSGGVDIIHPLDYEDFGKVVVYQPKTRVDLTKEIESIPFAYDNVYGEESTNRQIYNRSLRNLIRPFLDGQWATCFAYGQTGSGKTFTMMGSSITGINAGTATSNDSNLGLYYLAALEIFELLKQPQYSHLSLRVSLFEIYGGGKLYDLLNGRKVIKCLENSRGMVCFPGLTEHPVESPNKVMELIEQGAKQRSTGTTSRNADSSRSHAVLQLRLVKRVGRKNGVEHSRFSFIDLAGSERGADTSNASKSTRLEGADINTSLLALKEVIRALATGGSMTHIPFRGSKLTQVLKDSFVGENARCVMVACISPDIGNCEQTLNTLRYADRVKERDPENGALSSSCEQPTRIFGLAHDMEVTASEEMDLDCARQHGPESESTSTAFMQDRVSLASHELVSSQKEITRTWLDMLGHETKLIQNATDERGWQEYYDQFEQYEAAERAFISKLRKSLQNYIDEKGLEYGISSDVIFSDEESFEDLRD